MGNREIFLSDRDRELYLDLVFRHARKCFLGIWGYCLMRDHVHFLVEPFLSQSLARTFGRANADYARYLNVRQLRAGQLWQARFSSCAVAEDRVWAVLAFIERNPVRAGLAENGEDYEWSSARQHCLGHQEPRLELAGWSKVFGRDRWRQILASQWQETALEERIREATRTGVPFGSEQFVLSLSRSLGRDLRRRPPGRPRTRPQLAALVANAG
ncbi:MAG: transposase [Acidobacteria bacterium]|nr:transposase [Acidobacteriota bacterium]